MTRPHDALDHGAIGNGRVLALIAPTTAIEWLCLPRFDGPSLFARLLDRAGGGTCRILWRGAEVSGAMSYLRNTNVLVTRVGDDTEAFEVIDFAPWLPLPRGHRAPPIVVRLVRPVLGHPRIRLEVDARPDYGRAPPRVSTCDDGLVIDAGAERYRVWSSAPADYLADGRDFALREPVFVAIGPAQVAAADVPTAAVIDEWLAATVTAWRDWTKTCALPSFAADAVLRSALCLKLHIYADTGAVIAAATTSIPEALGTPRTWDYRYCWLRDAAFVVEALRRLSHLREGERFLDFLRDAVEGGPLLPVYSLTGGRELDEVLLPHLAGFAGNGHVRIGNAAVHQRQHDLMGEIVLCLETLVGDPRLVLRDEAALFPLIRRMVEEAIALAAVPDTGIWEFRTLLRNYTFSRAMCWVAVDRGARLAARFGEPVLAARWREHAARERAVLLDRGFSTRHGYFTQALDGEHPDASLLLLPSLGLIDARDPRFLSTLDAYAARLAPDGLMRRYVNPDDFGATTSAFTICSLWWAEALALAGRLDQAVEVFARIARHANPLGLFSEDLDPATGALLGNFPQAYTHVGLINAAMTIGDLLDARDRRFGPWTGPRPP